MELDFEVKEENDTEELQSDDELLSVIQRIKYENVKDEESKENGNIPLTIFFYSLNHIYNMSKKYFNY